VFPLGNAASSVTITNPRPTQRSTTPVATKVERESDPNTNIVQDHAGSSCDHQRLTRYLLFVKTSLQRETDRDRRSPEIIFLSHTTQ